MSEATLYLGKADQGAVLSREEFAEAQYEEPWRYERVSGRLVVMPPSGHDHAVTGEPMRDYLVVYKVQHREVVEHVISEAWIAVDDDTDRIADIGVYLRGRKSSARIPNRVPELVVEVVSEGSEARGRDYDEKRGEYFQLGVREYVIVDRFQQRVTVLRRKRTRIEETALTPTDVYRTPLLPGLEVPLAEVF